MNTTTELKIAFERAGAILRLEGFEKTPDLDHLEQEIIAGRMSFDEAVQHIIAKTKTDHQAHGT
jgi:hypothetical protein